MPVSTPVRSSPCSSATMLDPSFMTTRFTLGAYVPRAGARRVQGRVRAWRSF
jgi:hypothetical protein